MTCFRPSDAALSQKPPVYGRRHAGMLAGLAVDGSDRDGWTVCEIIADERTGRKLRRVVATCPTEQEAELAAREEYIAAMTRE